jgi:hypothetical protein
MTGTVGDSNIAILARWAVVDQSTIAIDCVTVQIQSDVVRANHDAIARTADEISVESRIRRDGGATPHHTYRRLGAGRPRGNGESE